MASIQEQVVKLTDKVDSLYHMIDRVSEQVTAILASSQLMMDADEDLRLGHSAPASTSPRYNPSLLDTVCEHKDILVDSGHSDLERQSIETHLSQDIQIQRLTAQLTAAYNRIAALEEQLLAVRVHS